MDIKSFFDDKGKVESFFKAKTEQEARSILESECGKVSDDEFNEIKKGFLTAVSEEALGEASGGAFNVNMSALKSPLAKTVYKVGGAALTVVGVAALSHHLGKRSGQTAGYEKGSADVRAEYNAAAAEGVESWVNKAGVFNYLGTGEDHTYHHITPMEE